MTREQLRARDLERLSTVLPDLARRVLLVLNAMRELGHDMMISDASRTAAQQAALYAQGRTMPGRIVTYANGVTTLSNHQSGRAVDCVFLDADNQPDWSETRPWNAYGACARAVGLSWGGLWTTPDKPHVELPVLH